MALSNKKITVMADTVVGLAKIASYSATVGTDTTEINTTTRYIDADTCESNMETIKDDRTAFEAFAFSVQDYLREADL